MRLSFLIAILFIQAAVAAPDTADTPPVSTAAQKLFAQTRNDLLQIRSLLRNGRTQSSVGSGFLVQDSHLVLTNYHVVSEFALHPERYEGEYVATNGEHGKVELLAIDVLHDLAVLRIARQGSGSFRIPEQDQPLQQGQHIYSLGNPLDLGFAISEGAFNGEIHRNFYAQYMFTGAINPGMSGGPSLTEKGQVAGINVSKRLDGELVSFLVPVRFARELLQRASQQKTSVPDFNLEVGKQLLEHQKLMTQQILAQPFTIKAMGPYRAPVQETEQIRCWGKNMAKPRSPYSVDALSCQMDSAVFINERLQTGQVTMRHEFLSSKGLNTLRFSTLASASFTNENFGEPRDRNLTKPICTEQFVNNTQLPLRAVLCVRAYRKFEGLYDFALLTTSIDSSQKNLLSRIDASGVSYENGIRLTRVFLEAIAKEARP